MYLRDHSDIAAVLKKLDAHFQAVYDEKRIAGMAVALVYDQEMLWGRGYGYADLEHGLPADTQTVFDIGSIVKIFTDTMLMQLRDAGKVNLDDPLAKHLPEFRIGSPYPDPRPPTFREVAAHIAGIPREPGYALDESGVPTLPSLDVVLRKVQGMQLVYPPMTGVHYSNLGVYLVGHALARAAGQPYQEYVKEHILEPLGMCSSGWALTPAMQSRRAARYIPLMGIKPRRRSGEVHFGDVGAPGGGLSSTVEDMARFVALQFRVGSVGGQQILGSTSLREMRLPVWGDLGWGVGLGWWLGRVAGHDTIHHSGSAPGCSATMHIVPDLKMGFVLLMNEMTFLEDVLARQALELAIPVLARALERPRAASPAALPSFAPDCVGRYDTLEAWALEVALVDGQMQATLGYAEQSLLRFGLAPEERRAFRIQGSSFDGEPVTFEVGSDGRVTGLLLWGLPFSKVGTT